LNAGNNTKSAKLSFDNGVRLIIDPSHPDIDPENHITFTFSLDFPLVDYSEKNGSVLGMTTIGSLKLKDRDDLLLKKFPKIYAEIRSFFIDLLTAIIDQDTTKRKQKEEELRRVMSAHFPFASFKRQCVRSEVKVLNGSWISKAKIKYNRDYEETIIDFPKGYEVVY